MNRLDAVLTRVEDTLHVVGCAALILVAVLINADIVSRFLFRIPVQFQFELVEFYLMPAIATLSLARVFRTGGHLALELLHPETFPNAWPAIRVVMLLGSAAFFATLSVMSGRFAAEAFLGGEVYFGIVDWPLGWAYLPVPVGAAVLTARLLLETTRRSASEAPPNH